MRCVVCDGALTGDSHYANAWERSRKKMPCCSPTCAGRFNPDVHWIPAALPAIAVGDDQVRLRALAFQRLGRLDEARPVVRELLCAGIKPETLRSLVAKYREDSADEQRDARNTTIAGVLNRVFFGHGKVRESRDQRTAKSYAAAAADLEQWDRAVARATLAG